MFVEKVRVRGRRGGGRMWNRRKENQRKCLFYTVDNIFFLQREGQNEWQVI